MLSSSPSLLLSALSPLSLVGEAAGTAAGEAAPGFAELLNGLAAKATEAVSSEQAGTGDRDEPAVGDQPAPVKDKAIAHAGRPTPARKTGDEIEGWWQRTKDNIDKRTDADKDGDGK